jgi:transcription-repair coupling factor (superfamily II helicase)
MLDRIRSHPAYGQLLSTLNVRQPIPALSLSKAARLPILASLSKDLSCPILFILARADQVHVVQDELEFWTQNGYILTFPEPTPLFYEKAAWGSTTRRERLRTLSTLASYHLPSIPQPASPPIVLTTVRGLMTRTLPRRDFLISTRAIKKSQVFTPEGLMKLWVDLGYETCDVVLESGQISRRGGILDIWPPAESDPCRIEFFGNDIDTLRKFDPSSQRTIEPLASLVVTPAREFIPSRGNPGAIIENQEDEFFLPLIHSFQASLLDYLPSKSLVVFSDHSILVETAEEIEEQAVRFRDESIQEGVLDKDFPTPYLSWSELEESIHSRNTLDLGFSAESDPSELSQTFTSQPRFAGHLKPLVEYLIGIVEKGESVTVVSRQVLRLKELWTEKVGEDQSHGTPEFLESTLSEGLIFTQVDGSCNHLLTDSEIFGWERPQPRVRMQQTAAAPEDGYSDLKPGDWVVHVDNGIGKLTGLVRRNLEGSEREFLCVEYDGGDQLYVPIFQADRLSRYIGPDERTPQSTRLGTAEWVGAKEKVSAAVQQVANDLLILYAQRQLAEGHAFNTDSTWQLDLESSFPYIETPDQQQAIQDVKKDMESQRPMDRLLCGDVGYGKTEVALRAAFKAVIDGKQVALLVPTTVLAQQHFETFRDRLTPFPVTVEMLSRFRTPHEQDEIAIKLALGEVDIVVGTHRLLQPDIQFKDLGLIIIDEEQRFGVTHKEFFKRLRTEVDVLTLTATPIPRTLYQALTGVRDISVINTPPAERLPIITHVGPYSPKLVRQAVLRELERGGQIFFVHNRVQSINAMRSHLNHLVPEARLGIAHGQMHETDLSAVMHDFTRGEVDILLCTSIIESGLDIPNANTLIVDRGDTFGLAQLYQLRGRVGRGAQRAYAYFFRHKRRMPSNEGQERLEVIAENNQLGAGYSIAMRDLEMRGAGDLLGTRQSGFIAAVGFHLYTRMLAQAVRQLRGQAYVPGLIEKTSAFKEIRNFTSVDLPLTIGIPVEYIADQNLRLRIYRRIADTQSPEEVDALEEEFQDRFGPLPAEVSNLLYDMRVKALAERAGLASVTTEGEQVVFRFPPLPEGKKEIDLPVIPGLRAGKNSYWLVVKDKTGDWGNLLIEAIQKILDARAGFHRI